MTTIYAVICTKRECDRELCAVFSTRELAEKHATEHNKLHNPPDAKYFYDHAGVEEWQFDVLAEATVQTVHRAHCDRSGVVAVDVIQKVVLPGHTKVDGCIAESTVSKEHAIKLAVEARQAWSRERKP